MSEKVRKGMFLLEDALKEHAGCYICVEKEDGKIVASFEESTGALNFRRGRNAEKYMEIFYVPLPGEILKIVGEKGGALKRVIL